MTLTNITLTNLLCNVAFFAGIGDGFYKTAVIGDFQEADAKAFLEQQQNASNLTAEDWSTVYQVRGS